MKVKVTSLSVLLVSVFLLSALFGVQLVGVASAEGPYDWPMFHHDLQHSGYSESPGPNTNQTLWTTALGTGAGSDPAIVDGRIFIGSSNGKFYCFNATTGTLIWNYTNVGEDYCSPAVADGKVYVGSFDNNTYCFNATTGTLIWNYTASHGVYGAPSVVDGKVYVGSQDTNIYCLDATTGTKIWNYTTGDNVMSAPTVVDGKLYVGSHDYNVYCLNATTGTKIWNYTTGYRVGSAPAVVDGKLYVGSGDDNVYCLDATTGTKIWNYTTGDNVHSSPAIAYGNVYIGSNDDNLYCLDAATGTKIWNYTTGDRVFASPAVADGKVYATSWDNNVYCLDAATGGFIWSYTTGYMVWGSPVVANGVLYLAGTDDTLYAFGAEPPLSGTAWSKTYGGTGDDVGTGETVQTSDGGYAVSGDTNSYGAGGFDYWLFKTDADGNMEWNQTYGGALDETIHDMCQTSDGGYAMSGTTESFGAGGTDAYLVKTDADGNLEWNMTYGGAGDENGRTIVQTADGGYTITGHTDSYGAGGFDAWLIKIDASGNMEWNMTYGGTGEEDLDNVVQTGDGGYLFAGQTDSFGAGGVDGWLVKTNASGNMLWNQTYGGTGIDITYTIALSGDGGYGLTGFSNSFGGYKIYFVKTDEDGNMLWNKTYATKQAEIGIHGILTSDEGYAIVGWNYANGQDFVLYKIDAAGDLDWNMSYGGTGLDNGYAVLEASDGGYVLTGTTQSFGAGGSDVWLVKVDESGVIPESFTIVVVVLLSTVAVIVSFLLLRKRPKLKNTLLEKT